MFDLQSRMIFPRDAVPEAGPLPHKAQKLSVKVPGGDKLVGTYMPPDKRPSEKTLILGFGGNAWNGQDVAEYLHELFPEADVVAFHYRGYAPSSGEPSAETLLADAPLVYDAALEKVKPQRIVAVGFSIGSGVAAELASKRRLDGLILVTPFDSLKSVAQSMYPWVPIGPFFSHEIEAAVVLRKSDVPVAIVAAERDEIVRPERTNALRTHVRNLVFDRTIARAGHNDIYARSDFHDAMHAALTAVSE